MKRITEEKFLEIFEGLKNNKEAVYFYKEGFFDEEGFALQKDSICWEIEFGMGFTKGFFKEWKGFSIIKKNTLTWEMKETFIYVKLSRETKKEFKEFLLKAWRDLREKKRRKEGEVAKELIEGFVDGLTRKTEG